MKRIIPLFFSISLFLIIKIANNSVRLSDTNIYFNIAYQISQGKLLYKDIFFSNFPFFSYASSFYYMLSGKNIDFFYLTSAIEVSVITIFIYLIVYRKTTDYMVSIISSLLYIFSFIVLSTSDHQTGIFTASLFAILSYYFFQEKKMLLSGIFIAISFLTKAYLLPILISFYMYLTIKKEWKKSLKFSIGLGAVGLIILLPFLIQAPKAFFSDIFGFSLTRPIGLSKINIMWFFIVKDFPLFVLLLFNIINIRRNVLFGLMSILSIIFFAGYKDIYYLYLNFLTPFLCISFYELDYFFKNKLNLQKMVIPTIILAFLLYNLITYLSAYRNLGKLPEINKVIGIILEEKPDFLFGVNDITPLLLSLTKIPPLENVSDAHEYFFTKGVYDRKLLTEKAISNKTVVIAHGANYPQYGIQQDILDNIFIKDSIYESCKIILSVPVQAEGDTNRINLFKCY